MSGSLNTPIFAIPGLMPTVSTKADQRHLTGADGSLVLDVWETDTPDIADLVTFRITDEEKHTVLEDPVGRCVFVTISGSKRTYTVRLYAGSIPDSGAYLMTVYVNKRLAATLYIARPAGSFIPEAC
jgi:hypothetical protein